MKEKILQLWELLKKSKKILLINHIRMDPDAFWSLAWFYNILKNIWDYEVKATNDEKTPDDFNFLWNNNIIDENLDIKRYNPDLIISFDAASLDQLWNKYLENKEIFEMKKFVVIDHHITNPWFWKLNIIDINSSSSCELTFEIIETLKLEKYIDKNIATLLTTWILTDTNMYYNVNTTAKTLETGAKLLKYWADFRNPMFNFFKKKEFNKSKLWWEVLKDIKKTPDWKIVWWIITNEIFEKTSTTEKDTSWLINEFLSNIEWCEISFLLYPLSKTTIKASFRSSWYDVASLCLNFWWWWHKQAAGFNSNKSLDEIEKIILEKLN